MDRIRVSGCPIERGPDTLAVVEDFQQVAILRLIELFRAPVVNDQQVRLL